MSEQDPLLHTKTILQKQEEELLKVLGQLLIQKERIENDIQRYKAELDVLAKSGQYLVAVETATRNELTPKMEKNNE